MKPVNDIEIASSDAAIVKRVQDGDKQAYNILVIKYQHRVLQIAQKFVPGSVDAKDIAQEAFIKAYRAIGSFRGESSFYTWLYRIVVNCAKTYLDQNSKMQGALDVDAPEFESQDVHGALASHDAPDSLIEGEELKRVIFKALSELPEDLRQAITLREIEGLSYEEISLRVGVAVGTVKSRIFRARQYIEEQMSGHAN